jgi:hypothetical protein
MNAGNPTRAGGFIVAAGERQPFWFLSTLTIVKTGSGHSHGQLSILDHRVPPGLVPPPHLHYESGEALLVLDGRDMPGIFMHRRFWGKYPLLSRLRCVEVAWHPSTQLPSMKVCTAGPM